MFYAQLRCSSILKIKQINLILRWLELWKNVERNHILQVIFSAIGNYFCDKSTRSTSDFARIRLSVQNILSLLSELNNIRIPSETRKKKIRTPRPFYYELLCEFLVSLETAINRLYVYRFQSIVYFYDNS